MKYCNFCGHQEDSTSKHVHVFPIGDRKSRKLAKNWSYV